jgi:hypothetical protein
MGLSGDLLLRRLWKPIYLMYEGDLLGWDLDLTITILLI